MSTTAGHDADLELPAIGAAAELVPAELASVEVTGDDVVETRIDDVRDGRIAVHAPPPRPGDLEPPADGAAFELRWATPRGLVTLPVELSERVRTPAPLWWLVPAGPSRRHQRRSFVRAGAASTLPVQVEVLWEHPEPGRCVGDLHDLSEGGLRARIRAPRWALECAPGSAVAVRLTISEVDRDGDGLALQVVEHELGGTLVRLDEDPAADGAAAGGAHEAVDVVVQLHDDRRQGDALRALVFAWQRRSRRA
ncbi:PilZ domain-containing protein [Quadrisphaera granulorum]|uniref:PilZ domain-containing protein n=1 Tax=Quadrisphaera granulorum TaxID=317664 RepID=A0A316A4T8_9ACTN|nr:PilZ domain-containing protein [Quadrisphaera granulorum]PWJ52573.1 PilZ domain-containing protein [Quadrisphaera granulorum]SZE97623.1 PilZ domain-containing protein [Quadrisphaera granulorum]